MSLPSGPFIALTNQPRQHDTLSSCRYEPSERPTAEAALAHDYFEPIARILAREEEAERRRRLYPFLPPGPTRGAGG